MGFEYNIWIVFSSAVIGGGVGGFANLLTSGSSKAPSGVVGGISLGTWATVLIGAIAGGVAWAPNIASLSSSGKTIGAPDCLAAGLTAVLVGLQGSKWLTAEADKKNFQSAAAIAAGKPADPKAATEISAARHSLAALNIANKMTT